MAYKLAFSNKFKKSYTKLTLTEKKQVEKKLKILAENPIHPSLRSKRIQGTSDLFESSVNMDIRIIWCYDGVQIILFLDIGHHDILRKY